MGSSFTERIDPAAVAALERRALPAPIDALNLVRFADERSYRWYGLLLAPALIPFGARPVWVAVHERALFGEARADEIVIVRYPDHRMLLRAVTGRYYAWANRWRERGVRGFEFSLTERVVGGSGLGEDASFLVVHYNDVPGRDPAAVLERLRVVVETGPARLCYASREVASLAILRDPRPSDPNEAEHKRFAVFRAARGGATAGLDVAGVAERLGADAADLSVQLYRRLSYREAMPWAARTR